MGNRDLTILAAADLGDLGAAQGKTVHLSWRWYYSMPALTLWSLLIGLLVILRENRKWQVWLILVLPVVALLGRWGISADSGDLDLLLYLTTTFPLAWTCVWLSAPYLKRRTRKQVFFSAVSVMFLGGLLAYLGYFGFWCASQACAIVIIVWTVGSVALTLGLLMAGRFCGGNFRLGRFVVGTVLVLPAVTAGVLIPTLGGAIVVQIGATALPMLVLICVQLGIASLFVSGFLFAVNFPVLVLAGFTDCYWERLKNVVCPVVEDVASSTGGNPFSESPVSP